MKENDFRLFFYKLRKKSIFELNLESKIYVGDTKKIKFIIIVTTYNYYLFTYLEKT